MEVREKLEGQIWNELGINKTYNKILHKVEVTEKVYNLIVNDF